MITDTTLSSSIDSIPVSFGMRLQLAREALGLDAKDTASQLRLNEKVILMMESDTYSADLPTTFIRGYLRAYGKLLHLPDTEIKQAVDTIAPHSIAASTPAPAQRSSPLTSSHFSIRLLTSFILLTLTSLAGIWWYSHTNNTPVPTNKLAIPVTPHRSAGISGMPTTHGAAPATPPAVILSKVAAATVNVGTKLNDDDEDASPTPNSDNAD